ncbi:MAG: IS66 family insertion sequence element accessory protein TnpB [Steroidobacteraceae bacterium]
MGTDSSAHQTKWAHPRPRARQRPYGQDETLTVDFRSGIDGLSRVCRSVLQIDPFSGVVVLFRSRSQKSIKLLVYDGQGFWVCQKRLSKNRFRFWPSATDAVVSPLLAHEFQVLIFGGDPSRAQGAPMWRRLGAETPPSQPS